MKGKSKRVKNFEDATKSVHYINFLLCLRVLEWPRGHLRPYHSIVYHLCITAFLVWNLKFEGIEVLRNSILKFETILYHGMFFITTVSLSVMSVLGLSNTRRFIDYKKAITKIEGNLEQLGGWIDISVVHRLCLIFMSLWMVYITLSFLFYVKWFGETSSFAVALGICLSYGYGETVGSVLIIDFVTCVYWLKLGFEQTNLLLSKGFQGPEIFPKKLVELDRGKASFLDFRNICGKKRNPDPIRVHPKIYNERLWIWKIRQIHLELCRSAKLIFDIYSMQMGLEMALTLMFFTGKLYYLYIEVTRWDQKIDGYMEVLALSITDCFVLAIKLSLLCAVCEYTLREIKRTNEIIYNLADGSGDPEFKDEVHQFALQMTQNAQGFAAYGFSRLSFNYIRVFFSSVSTYLVIMIQMSETSEVIDYSQLNRTVIFET